MFRTGSKRQVNFGEFQLDLDTAELKNNGSRSSLIGQPLQILTALLERPGELVTREELKKKLWPEDTFVDFDQSLNKAVNRLREALNDSAEHPRFIETLSRRGYRFAAPVQIVSPEQTSASVGANRDFPQSGGRFLRWRWLGVMALLLVAASAIHIYLRSRSSVSSTGLEVVPLTGKDETESFAAFSPDGNQVAFLLGGEGRDGIYTMLTGGEAPLRLTSDSRDCCPVWSPDGRTVAFARGQPSDYTIYTVPSLGGNPKALYTNSIDFPEHIGLFPPTFSWSPDGTQLAITTLSPSLRRPAIALLSLQDFSLHPITSPPREFSDWAPAFSPDGKILAFLRSSGPGLVDDLYVVPATGGEARRLTFDNRLIGGAPAWSPDGRDIVFSSGRAGLLALWRIRASGGTPQRVEGMGTSMADPAVSPKAHRLAYTNFVQRVSLRSVRLTDPMHAEGVPQQLFRSKAGAMGLPYFSADGNKIAFESSQSGYDEIWSVNSDGSNPAQLTFLRGETGTPRWSYDGRSVAFDYRPSERSEIFIADDSGRPPRIFPTNPGANNIVPSWARDGHWLYFASSRGNEPIQVWKAHYPEGGTVQLTQDGGTFPVESGDGFLYYSKSMSSDEIWRIPAAGGPESLVLKVPGLDCFCNWTLAPTGIYFITERTEEQSTLSFYDFASKKLKEVLVLEKYGNRNPAISPDGKFLIYVHWDQQDYTIMLVNNFY